MNNALPSLLKSASNKEPKEPNNASTLWQKCQLIEQLNLMRVEYFNKHAILLEHDLETTASRNFESRCYYLHAMTLPPYIALSYYLLKYLTLQ